MQLRFLRTLADGMSTEHNTVYHRTGDPIGMTTGCDWAEPGLSSGVARYIRPGESGREVAAESLHFTWACWLRQEAQAKVYQCKSLRFPPPILPMPARSALADPRPQNLKWCAAVHWRLWPQAAGEAALAGALSSLAGRCGRNPRDCFWHVVTNRIRIGHHQTKPAVAHASAEASSCSEPAKVSTEGCMTHSFPSWFGLKINLASPPSTVGETWWDRCDTQDGAVGSLFVVAAE
ncbi:uncharacterized protein VTP21DRAFT_8769 [Calcarisporiella thermophila]|uniref:uncharacterized protein n=1 Tax=Calcarisporiella thermophila TaxID=911321 RepID=UPI003742FB8C